MNGKTARKLRQNFNPSTPRKYIEIINKPVDRYYRDTSGLVQKVTITPITIELGPDEPRLTYKERKVSYNAS